MKHARFNFLFFIALLCPIASNASKIHDAVRDNNIALVEQILKEHPGYIYTRNNYHRTPLQVAVANGHLEMVKFLVERGADVNPVTIINGYVDPRHHPVNIAIENKQPEILKYLLSKGSGRGGISKDTIFNATQNAKPSFVEAITRGDVESVKSYISDNYNLNKTLGNSLSPLQLAAERGKTEIAGLLIDEGADLNFKANIWDGGTSLHIAIKRGYEDTALLLIQRGADVTIKDNQGFNPLYYSVTLKRDSVVTAILNKGIENDIFDASLLGDLERVKFLIGKNPALISAKHPFSRSPLHFAAECNRVEVMKYLMRKGAKIDFQDLEGLRPLNLAASAGAFEAAELLIKKGAAIGPLTVEEKVIGKYYGDSRFEVSEHKIRETIGSGSYSDTPLYSAVRSNQIAIADLLIKAGADVNIYGRMFGASNSIFEPPLHVAVRNNNKEMVEFLLKKGADPFINSNHGENAFSDVALSPPVKEEIGILLLDYGLDPNEKESDGNWTILHNAARNGMARFVSAMLDRGGDPLIGKPLESAIINGHKEVVEILVSKKPEVLKGERAESALRMAISYYKPEILEFLLDHISNLLQVNLNEAMQKALSNGYVEAAEIFFAKDLKLPPIPAATALYDSARIGCVPIVEMILKSGANVNQPLKERTTPFHGAVEGGNIEIVKMFLENGADLNAIDDNYRTPLMVALNQGNEDVCLLLLDKGAKFPDSSIYESKPLPTAASKGMAQLVLRLIETPDEKTREKNIELALKASISAGELDVVNALAEKGVDISRISGNFMIENALNQNHFELAKLLIEKGVEVNQGAQTSPLSVAVSKDAYEIVELLLQKDANADGTIGTPPLCEAASRNNIKIAELLIKHGADINGARGQIPLFNAISFGRTEMIDLLINSGADIFIKNRDDATALHAAVDRNDPLLISMFIEKGLDPDVQNKDGKTPLIKALENQKYPVVPVLVANTGDASLKDKNWRTALHFNMRKIETCQALIAKGANVNAQDNEGRTPIFYNLYDAKICKFLLDAGADINHRDMRGDTPIIVAIQYSSYFDKPEMVEFLMRNGADLSGDILEKAVNYAMRSQGTKVFKAVLKVSGKKNFRNPRDSRLLFNVITSANRTEYARMLLDMGADPNVTNERGVSVLAKLADGLPGADSILPLTMLLLERGANPDVTYQGKPLLTHYLERGKIHAAILLLNAGATVSKQDIEHAFKSSRMSLLESIIKAMSELDYVDSEGNTALHLAAFNGRPKTAEILLKRGADLKARNKNQQTPLHRAASKGMRKTVELFIKNKAEIDAVDNEGNAALHLAVAGGYPNTAELLVKKSANMNITNKRGETPLHIAINLKKNDIAIMLIKSEADVNVQNIEGKTPLHLAAIQNNPDMVKILVEYFARADIKDKSGKMPIDYARDDKIKDLLRKYGVRP